MSATPRGTLPLAFSDSFTLDEEAVSHCESSIDGIGHGEIGARSNANLRSTSIEFAVCVVQKLLFPSPLTSLPTYSPIQSSPQLLSWLVAALLGKRSWPSELQGGEEAALGVGGEELRLLSSRSELPSVPTRLESVYSAEPSQVVCVNMNPSRSWLCLASAAAGMAGVRLTSRVGTTGVK